MDTKAICNLKASPLFALTLGAKELSHSNFWGWLIEWENEKHEHPFIKVFYKDYDESRLKFKKVIREENHRDLTIHFKDKTNRCQETCFVIENKLKSMPRKEQLVKYEKELIDSNKSFLGGTVTGIGPSTVANGLCNWKFISYEDIADEMEIINEQEEHPSKEIIKNYVDDLKNITAALDCARKKTDKYIWEAPCDLEAIRLGDVYLKLRADFLKDKIEEALKGDEFKSHWGRPIVEAGFNNKKPTITVVYIQKNENKEIGRIGVQIEGNQFRIYGGPSYEASKLKSDEEGLFKKFKEIGWFEDYQQKKIRSKNSSMRNGKGYCKYSSSSYIHLYQYYCLEKEISTKELICNIKQEMHKVKKIIDNNRIDSS